MFWKRIRLPLTTLLLVAPWLYLPGTGPSPQIERWLLSALALAAVLLWLPGESTPQRNASLLRMAGWSLFLAALCSVAIGYVQYIGRSAWFPGLVAPAPPGTAYANLLQRNQFATLTVLGLAALRMLVMTEAPSRVVYWLAGVSALALGLGNALSASRIGLLGLLAWCMLCWRRPWASTPTQRWLPLLALLSYMAVAAWAYGDAMEGLDGGIIARLQDHSEHCASRLVLWRNVLDLIALKPWSGWGWGELGYAHFSTLYAGDRFCDILDNAHNLPLQLAVTEGLPVALLVCAVLTWWVVRNVPWQDTNGQRQFAWSVLLALGLHSMVEYPLWYGPFQLALLMALWLLWETRCWARQASAWPVARAMAPAMALLLAAAVSYAAWDYHRISQIYRLVSQRTPAYREDTLTKIRDSFLFAQQVKFAELSLTPVDVNNAETMLQLSQSLLHYSAEPMVVERLLEAANILGREEELQWALARYARAFAQDHARWVARNPGSGEPPQPSVSNKAP